MQKRRIIFFIMIISITMILAGCFKGEQSLEEVDPPKDAVNVDGPEEGKSLDDEAADDSESITETVARELYLIDANGMVAPQTVELPMPDSKEVAKQVLEYLVEGGPITTILPNGFRAVLPEGTEILGITLEKDGTMVIDVSEEFKNYQAEDEKKILEAMTFTVTQFENVKKINIWINGHPLDEMPVDGTPISGGYSRSKGINIIETGVVDFINSESVTMYFPTEHNNTRYYVPVTKYVEVHDQDTLEAVVAAIIKGPGYQTNLTNVFNPETLLVDTPKLKDGVLQLVFNEEILEDAEKAMISDEVIETLVRSLTELQSVEAVDIKVENLEQLVNENGEVFNQPVMKNKFIPVEKL